MSYMEKYQAWLSNPYFDEATKAELKGLDEKEIEDRFYKDLAFGTGGLRGVLGAGTNRMNIYTVRKATQGLANFINLQATDGKQKSVAIAYDSRNMSTEFADESARVLAANGIKAYVFESLRPTPELSFAVRELGCISGIVITASHNPPEYNGYKVYWEDGAQVTSPKDVQIIEQVNLVEDFATVKTMPKEEAMAADLYEVIGEAMDDLYIAQLKKLIIDPEVIEQEAKDFTIVYTPLHGTGNIPVRRILKEIGFTNVYVVPEQELPDGNFPTVGYPNPEDAKAFALALKLAEEVSADVVMATDPDADRLGVFAKTKEGTYEALNGNNIGMILMHYILSRKADKGVLADNSAVVGTVVSTYMARAIAKEFDVTLFETLTGFKYIGEKIKEFEEDGSYTYQFGYEESYGALIGTHARDKDAVVAVMGVAEAAAYYKSQGITLYEALLNLFEQYGYYKETLQSITLKGIDGANQIAHILDVLRNNPPTELAGKKVLSIRDYDADTITDLETKEVTSTGLPNSNVLYFDLSDNTWFCVRPSGTEPKVKFYFGVKGATLEEANEQSKALEEAVMTTVDDIIK